MNDPNDVLLHELTEIVEKIASSKSHSMTLASLSVVSIALMSYQLRSVEHPQLTRQINKEMSNFLVELAEKIKKYKAELN